MWLGLAFLALILVIAAAGITGIGTYDSRDTRYNLNLNAAAPDVRPTYESLMTPQRRPRRIATWGRRPQRS